MSSHALSSLSLIYGSSLFIAILKSTDIPSCSLTSGTNAQVEWWQLNCWYICFHWSQCLANLCIPEQHPSRRRCPLNVGFSWPTVYSEPLDQVGVSPFSIRCCKVVRISSSLISTVVMEFISMILLTHPSILEVSCGPSNQKSYLRISAHCKANSFHL